MIALYAATLSASTIFPRKARRDPIFAYVYDESSQPTGFEDKLLSIIQEKDSVIREQAEEIGQLRERIAQLQREKGKNASDAQTSDLANVG